MAVGGSWAVCIRGCGVWCLSFKQRGDSGGEGILYPILRKPERYQLRLNYMKKYWKQLFTFLFRSLKILEGTSIIEK